MDTTHHVDPACARHQAVISGWLLTCCAMVFAMVVLGGVTRLTQSGLSMVEWAPLSGWLPPASETAWLAEFERYRHYPEFMLRNADMTLDGFKSIYWLEYAHRVWGRLIGVVFFVPLLVFAARGWITPPLAPRLVAMFVLGGAQGVLGWYMVMSGLVDRPEVSHYRLTAHLGLAFLIYGYMFWVALELRTPQAAPRPPHTAGLRRASSVILVLVCVTVLSGGFVAGLDAGLAYNTFPLMGGRWVPEHLLAMSPLRANVFENIATVQFDHRVLAMLTLLSVLSFAGACWRRGWPSRPARRAVATLLGVVVLQVGLGIVTLLSVVAVPVAAAHQAGALLLFTASLWALHALGR